MSLVGTRPPTVEEVAQYEEHHRTRLRRCMLRSLGVLIQLSMCNRVL